ncbi:MAG: FxsA family protein [Propionibacteriaceae bacterium]|nr:FxsA family protein [Propionibacteriaceae bacterium]
MRSRSGWLLPMLLVLLVAVPILEVWLLIQVGSRIGVLPTILILVAEAALGAWLMRREGARAWKALTDAFGTGRMPTGELADAALVLVGGVLLMLPGFATDVIGFFFLLPFTRPMARTLLGLFVARRIQQMGLPVVAVRQRPEDLIEGETVDGPSPPATGQPSDPRTISGEVDDGPGRTKPPP